MRLKVGLWGRVVPVIKKNRHPVNVMYSIVWIEIDAMAQAGL